MIFFSSNYNVPGIILNIKDIVVNKETNVAALRRLTFWWYEIDMASNDYSNVLVNMKNQEKGVAGLRREKKMWHHFKEYILRQVNNVW